MPASSTTTLSWASGPSYGDSIVLTAMVAPATGSPLPTGYVDFINGSNDLGTAPLISNAATLAVPADDMADGLSVGDNYVVAKYQGDGNFDSSSDTEDVNVGKATTYFLSAVSVSPSASLNYGDTATLSATVNNYTTIPYYTTGSVQFYEDATIPIGSPVPLDGSETATLNVDSLSVGSHTIDATYLGNSDYSGSSTTASQSVTVSKATVSTAFGEAIGYTACTSSLG